MAKRTIHLRSTRPRRKKRIRSGRDDERPAQVETLCGNFVETGSVVRFDRVPIHAGDSVCKECGIVSKDLN